MKRRSLVASLFGIMLIAFVSIGATLIAGRSPLLGLDLRGGVEVVLSPHGKVTTADLTQAVSIIDNRINHLGVANSSVERQGRDVVIELPGDKNSQQALKIVGTTAQLYFRPLACSGAEIPAYVPPVSTKTKAKPKAKAATPKKATAKSGSTTPKTATTTSRTTGGHLHAILTASTAKAATSTTTSSATAPATTAPATTVPTTSATTVAVSPSTATPSTTAPATTTPAKTKDKAAALADACSSASASSFPSTSPNDDVATNTVILPSSPASGMKSVRWVLGPADATGKIIKSATVVQPNPNTFAVQADLTKSGNVEFNKIAAVRNVYYQEDPTNPSYQAQEAIELDGEVESVPSIQDATFAGSVQITGKFTQSQASSLATELNYGSLPVRFDPSSVSTISATVGAASLRAGLYAGLGGVVLVLLYMIIYYRALGLVVVLGLLVGASLLYSILTELSYSSNLALTLSGVTGIIVSIGITVDSYVVYFERLKDEVRKGQTIRASVERGFARAFRTVLTADLVSFMAALILYLFTVGDVKGFAFTLGLSTLLDVFTAYFFIRPIVILLGRRRTTSEAGFLGIARGLGATSTAGGLIR